MTNFESIRQQARDSIAAELKGRTNHERLQWLLKESQANTAEMRAAAEEDLGNPDLDDRVKDYARIQLTYVEAQEQLDKLNAEWIANPSLPPVEIAHPQFMARHKRLQQLRDDSFNALVADGYVEWLGDDNYD